MRKTGGMWGGHSVAAKAIFHPGDGRKGRLWGFIPWGRFS
jgi:hypothetical protein